MVGLDFFENIPFELNTEHFLAVAFGGAILAEDVIEKDYDTWNATMSAVEPAEELIKIVQGLLAT